MSDFFEEVRRRKVYRVAVAYIIAAGFIIQIGSAVFPAWESAAGLEVTFGGLQLRFADERLMAWKRLLIDYRWRVRRRENGVDSRDADEDGRNAARRAP